MKKSWIELAGLRLKTCSYLINDDSEDEKAKGTKMCVMKRKLNSEVYKNCYKQLNLKIK